MDVAVMDRLEDILSSCEYNGGGISELLGKGTVKSVQRGTGAVKISGTTPHVFDIPISEVDPEKTEVNVTMILSASWNLDVTVFPAKVIVSTDKLTVDCSNMVGSMGFYYPGSYVWQLVEYY